MIEFAVVTEKDGETAYQWHRGGAAQNKFIFPRSWDEYKEIANAGRIWCARNSAGDYVGLAHYVFDSGKWEVGGLMVAHDERKSGIGSTLFCLALGQLLYGEDPLARGDVVMARIHRQNRDVGPLLERLLAFKHAGTIKVPKSKLLNNPTIKNGYVEGDEYHLVHPGSLLNLADWADGWSNMLGGSRPAKIQLPIDATLEIWAKAFRDMAH